MAACLTGAGHSARAADQSRPAQAERSSAVILQQAVHQLTEEAKQSLEKQQLARPAANFAGEFKGKEQFPVKLVGQRIIHPLHSDPFIDAYIRWQLTSFDPKLPDLDAHQFDKLLDELPKPIRNPRADRDLINTLIASGKTGALSAAAQESINKQLNDLSERASRAAALNQAALGLRAWLRGQLPRTGERPLLAGLEQCTALVESGWPVDDAKAKLDETFKAGDRDRQFTDEQRQSVINHMRPLIGKRTLYVTSAVISDGRLAVEYADTAIYDFDVRRWARSVKTD